MATRSIRRAALIFAAMLLAGQVQAAGRVQDDQVRGRADAEMPHVLAAQGSRSADSCGPEIPPPWSPACVSPHLVMPGSRVC